MEAYFSPFREQIIGIHHRIKTPYHASMPIVYTDWTASGRNYAPIENKIARDILPFVANTHTDTNYTGMVTTYAYHKAQEIIKNLVHASPDDILIASNSGMTGVVNKLQRILGLKVHESFKAQTQLKGDLKPVVFITHMEHHSNQTSWLETLADVVIVPPDETGLVSIPHFRKSVEQYKSRQVKIAAITSCSNVTGIMTPYYAIASLMHEFGGLCFVDFACSAPYVAIDMHPPDSQSALDAIYFSPHKFLGGPGSSGILIFNKALYRNAIPDNPGGGTVDWTNPWGEHKYIDNIEIREDGGTPPFLQTIKAALCMQLKEEMGIEAIAAREKEINGLFWQGLTGIEGLHLLAARHQERLPIFSFYIDDLHYIAAVKLLNDRFGIQSRGGCSCAGTYGHYLLNVDPDLSHQITDLINRGDCSNKPGWVRISFHPTSTDEEVRFVVQAIRDLAAHHREWIKAYDFDKKSNRIRFKEKDSDELVYRQIDQWYGQTSTTSHLEV